MKIVPELYCTDIKASRSFYLETLSMSIKYERPEDRFIYLTKDAVDIMIEQIDGKGRRWITGELTKPFGRGINLQWSISNLDCLYKKVLEKSPESIYLKLESKDYKCGKDILRKDNLLYKTLMDI
jgi:hypothetical protein